MPADYRDVAKLGGKTPRCVCKEKKKDAQELNGARLRENVTKSISRGVPFLQMGEKKWRGRRDSNPRPLP